LRLIKLKFDRKRCALAAALDDNDLVVVVQTLIHKCMENEKLCNELYLQIIKQTTDTKTGACTRARIPLV